MRLISSKWTFVTKWAFPAVWIGLSGVFVVTAAIDGTIARDPMFLIGPLIMIVVGVVMFRLYLWKLADSVEDFGDYLVAKRRGVEARVPITNVMNVSSSMYSNPKMVTLRLVQPSTLGKEISFIPSTPLSLNPFAKVQVAEDLMERAFAARGKRVA